MSKRFDIELLRDMLEAIEKIQGNTAGISFEDFMSHDLKPDAVARNLGIIGEAAGRISETLTKANSQVPWRNITGLRHKIVHDYFDLDFEIIWEVLTNDLPTLKTQLEAIIKAL